MALSLGTTPRGLRRETEFSTAAIVEVACLFVGIFLTMQVPIEILRARGDEFGPDDPGPFLLGDRRPVERPGQRPDLPRLLRGRQRDARSDGQALVKLTDSTIRHDLLAAISLGAVFMGANTYIGNAPNLMVKLIAEQRRVKMPSFFGYMLYSGGVLIPLFIVVTLLFFPSS